MQISIHSGIEAHQMYQKLFAMHNCLALAIMSTTHQTINRFFLEQLARQPHQ
jgi:hypothetical protein